MILLFSIFSWVSHCFIAHEYWQQLSKTGVMHQLFYVLKITFSGLGQVTLLWAYLLISCGYNITKSQIKSYDKIKIVVIFIFWSIYLILFHFLGRLLLWLSFTLYLWILYVSYSGFNEAIKILQQALERHESRLREKQKNVMNAMKIIGFVIFGLMSASSLIGWWIFPYTPWITTLTDIILYFLLFLAVFWKFRIRKGHPLLIPVEEGELDEEIHQIYNTDLLFARKNILQIVP